MFLPFSHFAASSMWDEMAVVMTGNGPKYPGLPARKIKHLIVELYVATKKAVVGSMREDMQQSTLPILHYQLDLWTCEPSGRKFLGWHVYWVTSEFKLRHALLAVKHYAPSSEVQDNERASDILFTIFRATMGEYGIMVADLAGGTTDSGPDVKAMCVNTLHDDHDVCWDWCTCHLACKAAENAFGTSADVQKSKNPDARRIFSLVTKTAQKVNQFPYFKQKFDEIQMDMLEEALKITKHAPQRWLGMIRTLERIIRLWHVFRRIFAEIGDKFLLDEGDNKSAVLELYSLLQPLSAITRDGQFGEAPMTAEIHMAFAVLKRDVLDEKQNLRVFDIPPAPGSPEAEQERGNVLKGKRPPLPHKMVSPDKLHPVTVRTRKELNKALVQRLYGRIWDNSTADPSPFRDLAVVLTPPFNTGLYLESLRLTDADKECMPNGKEYIAPTTDEEEKEKLAGIWGEVKRRAIKAAREEKHRAEQREEAPEVQALKRARVEGGRSSTPASMFSSFGRRAAVGGAGSSGLGGAERDEVAEAVESDIVRYQSHFMTPEELHPKDVLGWWATKGKNQFPALAPVAQQVFGNQASAAQIERDFSGCGNLLPPNRSRMDTYWVEMVMFLKANFDHIPAYGAIPMVAPKDVRSCLPARFTGQDEDLVAAEGTFDLLNNTTAPTADGMSLE